MKSKSLIAMAGASALLVFAHLASAHPGHAGATGIAAGVTHPFTGIDHVLTMIAVGLCAAQIGRRALWMLPAAFLAFMIAGAILGIGGTHVAMAEQGIAASVLILGLLVAIGSPSRLPAILGLVALFAIFHGYAHGAEMSAGIAPLAYAFGFAIATAALLAIGIGCGMTMRRSGQPKISRLAGGAIAVCGLLLLCA
jgi:urease accessory protein